MRRSLHRSMVIGLCVIGLFAALLMQEPEKRIPSFLTGAQVDTGVRHILEVSCADCHSDSTRYPWYGWLPWISGVIEEDVRRGRDQLNLSRWHEYPRLRQMRALTGIANQVKDRAMPLREYVWLHPSASLTAAEVNAVFDWAEKERLRLIMEGVEERDVVK